MIIVVKTTYRDILQRILMIYSFINVIQKNKFTVGSSNSQRFKVLKTDIFLKEMLRKHLTIGKIWGVSVLIVYLCIILLGQPN